MRRVWSDRVMVAANLGNVILYVLAMFLMIALAFIDWHKCLCAIGIGLYSEVWNWRTSKRIEVRERESARLCDSDHRDGVADYVNGLGVRPTPGGDTQGPGTG